MTLPLGYEDVPDMRFGQSHIASIVRRNTRWVLPKDAKRTDRFVQESFRRARSSAKKPRSTPPAKKNSISWQTVPLRSAKFARYASPFLYWWLCETTTLDIGQDETLLEVSDSDDGARLVLSRRRRLACTRFPATMVCAQTFRPSLAV